MEEFARVGIHWFCIARLFTKIYSENDPFCGGSRDASKVLYNRGCGMSHGVICHTNVCKSKLIGRPAQSHGGLEALGPGAETGLERKENPSVLFVYPRAHVTLPFLGKRAALWPLLHCRWVEKRPTHTESLHRCISILLVSGGLLYL